MKKLLTIALLFIIMTAVYAFSHTAQASSSNSISPKQRNQATVTWKLVNGAKCYNIYYKSVKDSNWKYSVRCLLKEMWSYTIKHLFVGASYVYTVAALNNSGKEISFTQVAPLVAFPMSETK